MASEKSATKVKTALLEQQNLTSQKNDHEFYRNAM